MASLVALFLMVAGDDVAPVSPIWGIANATLNALTVVLCALIYTRRKP